MKTYEWICLDLDDTIIDDDNSRRGAYLQVCKRINIDYQENLFRKFLKYDNNFWKQRESGKLIIPKNLSSCDEIIKWLRAQRFLNNFNGITFEKALELNEIYCRSLSKNAVMIENADQVIKYLASKYKLVIATNGPLASANNKLKNVNLLKYFEYVIVAEEIGSFKPEKEFFEKLMYKINYYDKSKIAIIGDSIYSDITGGINIGIDTYWFNHKNYKLTYKLNITHEFNCLNQLYNLL